MAIDQRADLQDQIGSLNQRMTAIREEVISIQKEAVDEAELAGALTAFAPVWESLSPREQSGIVRLLVERVGYDGPDSKATVTSRSPGIKALRSEAAARDAEGEERTRCSDGSSLQHDRDLRPSRRRMVLTKRETIFSVMCLGFDRRTA